MEYPLPPQGLSKQIKGLFCLPIEVEFQGDLEKIKNKQNLQNWQEGYKKKIR